MPKLGQNRIDENRRRIEMAAFELFARQGFHGTNTREIAEKADLSAGAIYTYYPSKEAILESLVERYRARMADFRDRVLMSLADPFSKRDLRILASAMRAMVFDDAEFYVLMFIDVIEFRNRHFADAFHDLPEQFRSVLGPRMEEVKGRPGWCGHDPSFVFSTIYLYFFSYFVIQKLMQGKRQVGLPDETAIERFIDLLFGGLWTSERQLSSGIPDGKSENPTDQPSLDSTRAARDRIDQMRRLSAGLWSPVECSIEETAGKINEGATTPPMPLMFRVAGNRNDENQFRIEAAALDLFTTQGFHGTNTRNIAEKANVSTGAIYTHYTSKEAIYESLVEKYRRCMHDFHERVLTSLEDPFSKGDLRMLAWVIRSMVYDDAQYYLLMFIDIMEFENRHFADIVYRLPIQFRQVLGPVLDRVKDQRGWCGQEPALALATIYLYFFSYFVIERLMQDSQHLGVPDEQAIERFIDLLAGGLWGSATSPVSESTK